MRRTLGLSLIVALAATVSHGAVWVGWDAADVWSEPSNWSTGVLPEADEKVQLFHPAAQPCILDSDAGVTIGSLVIGDNNGPVSMIVCDGGLLTVGNWAAAGYNRSGSLTVEGGEITCLSIFAVGMYDDVAGAASLTMSGGQMTVSGTFFHGLYYDGSAAMEVRSQLDGGTLEVGGINLATGVMNIAGGTLVVNGDVTALLESYKQSGRLTAYDGSGGIQYDFGATHPGKTTVTAIPAVEGDVDGDFDADIHDLVLLALNWLHSNCGNPANFDQWCPVDYRDFVTLAANWYEGIVTFWHVVQTQYPTDELIVTPHRAGDFGIVADGVTDLTDAIQFALNSVANQGGGALFLPAGRYRVEGTLTVPSRVTLRGDWLKPEPDGPVVGTILEAYSGRGDENGTPFIGLSGSSGVKGVTFWYPEQLPSDIQPYPPTIQRISGSTHVVENVTFVNSYIGFTTRRHSITASPFVRNVCGSPLKTGIELDNLADVGRIETVHFSPDYWTYSGLPNAPVAEEHATWIYNNGTGVVLRRIDWSYSAYVTVEGYNIGLAGRVSLLDGAYPNGQCYAYTLIDCQTGVFFEDNSIAGVLCSRFDIQGAQTGFHFSNSAARPMLLHTCTIDASGYAILNEGAEWVLMVGSDIEQGTIAMDGGYLSVVDSDFGATAAQHVELGANVLGATIVGNRFVGGASILNHTASPVIVDHTPQTLSPLPPYDYRKPVGAFKPAKSDIFVVTRYPYGAQGDGVTDDTAAFQAALAAAQANSGGLVFVPGGDYRIDGTLTIPAGVELRGVFDIPHSTRDRGSVLNVYAGRNNGAGVPFIQIEASAGIRGLTFHYPEQIYDQSDTVNYGMVPYPFLMRGLGADIYVIHCAATIPYRLLDLATHRCDRHYVDYLQATALRMGIRVGGGSTDGQIHNCQFNPSAFTHQGGVYDSIPFNTAAGIHEILWRDSRPYVLGNTSGEILDQNFVFGGLYGVHLIEEGGIGPTGHCLGMGVDQCTNALQINGVGTSRLDFINSQLVTVDNLNGHYIETGNSFDDSFSLYNTACWGNPQISVVTNAGELNLQLFHVHAPGLVAYDINGSAGVKSVAGTVVQNAVWYHQTASSAMAEYIGNVIKTSVSQMPSNTSNVTSVGNIRVQ